MLILLLPGQHFANCPHKGNIPNIKIVGTLPRQAREKARENQQSGGFRGPVGHDGAYYYYYLPTYHLLPTTDYY
eukprot:12425507-Karenia_brevis.AAC.1